MKFILKRTVKHYEHTEVEAKDFEDALEQWLNSEPDSFDWSDSHLGEDYDLDEIEAEDGEGRDVRDGEFL